MQYGQIPGVDKPVSRLVQGTASMVPDDGAKSTDLLDLAVEVGINAFDQAHVYGEGRSRMVGRWMSERGNRDKVVLLAKGAHPVQGRKRVTPEDIASDVRESMEWMQTDYLDLFVLHRDDPEVPVGPIVEALNAETAAGRVHAFGGSNWTYERIREANEYASAHGLTPFAITSPHYSLAVQYDAPWKDCLSISGPDHKEARAYYRGAGMAVMPWSSLSGGFFSGRYRRDNLSEFDKADMGVRCYCQDDNFVRFDRALEIGGEKGLSVPQVAMAFLFHQGLNLFPLTFCWNRKEFSENTAALDVQLSQEECDYLDLKTDRRS